MVSIGGWLFSSLLSIGVEVVKSPFWSGVAETWKKRQKLDFKMSGTHFEVIVKKNER